MCGIAGFFDKKAVLDAPRRRQLIERMVDTIEHRGRDGRGFFTDDGVALGHVRLSILDPSERGAQPFLSDDGRLVLAYNGELYNFREINSSLLPERQMHSSCDTETLLCAWEKEEERALKRFKGMFAFSVYDAEQCSIVLATDRFGIKPLYYLDNSDWFAWSSEAKALLKLPGVRGTLNEEVLSEYILFRHLTGGNTLFDGIKRLQPAEVLRYDLRAQRCSKHRFWDVRDASIATSRDQQRDLLDLLSNSVREHLVADVPVGVQLSGGVDSSLVAALAIKESGDLHTFSIGLSNESWNEFRFSRKVAHHIGSIHTEITFAEEEFCRLLPKLTYYHDGPIGHSHSIPMFLLANRARKYGKVLLSGEGADEVFSGYKRYLKLANLQQPSDGDILLNNAFASPQDVRGILPKFRIENATRARRDLLAETSHLHWTQRLSYYDLETYLPSLLLRQDKMGMAANLENRIPFLDHELVTFGFALAPHHKISGDDNKILLKEIAAALLPRDIVFRPKIGFGQPIGEWLRNPRGLGRYLKLLRESPRNFLNHAVVQALIDEHLRGEDRTELLWILLTLEVWMRIFIDGDYVEAFFSDGDRCDASEIIV